MIDNQLLCRVFGNDDSLRRHALETLRQSLANSRAQLEAHLREENGCGIQAAVHRLRSALLHVVPPVQLRPLEAVLELSGEALLENGTVRQLTESKQLVLQVEAELLERLKMNP